MHALSMDSADVGNDPQANHWLRGSLWGSVPTETSANRLEGARGRLMAAARYTNRGVRPGSGESVRAAKREDFALLQYAGLRSSFYARDGK
jgi:hypothetical protein